MPADRIQRSGPSASPSGGAQGKPRTTRSSRARAPLQNLYTTIPLPRLNAPPRSVASFPDPASALSGRPAPVARPQRPAPSALQSFLNRQDPTRRPFSFSSHSHPTTGSCLGLTLGHSSGEPTDPLVSLPQQHDRAGVADVASSSQLSMFVHGPLPKPYVRGRVEALESASPQTPSPVLRDVIVTAHRTPEGWRSQWPVGEAHRRPFAVTYTSPTQPRRQEGCPRDVRPTATTSPRALRSTDVRPVATASLAVAPPISERQLWLEQQRELFHRFGFSEEQCLQMTWAANATVRRILPPLLPQLLGGSVGEARFNYFTTAQVTTLATTPGAGQFLPDVAHMTGMFMELDYHPDAIVTFVSRPHAQRRLHLLEAHRANLYEASANLRQALLRFYFQPPRH